MEEKFTKQIGSSNVKKVISLEGVLIFLYASLDICLW